MVSIGRGLAQIKDDWNVVRNEEHLTRACRGTGLARPHAQPGRDDLRLPRVGLARQHRHGQSATPQRQSLHAGGARPCSAAPAALLRLPYDRGAPLRAGHKPIL
jgi:hypothetical protein